MLACGVAGGHSCTVQLRGFVAPPGVAHGMCGYWPFISWTAWLSIEVTLV